MLSLLLALLQGGPCYPAAERPVRLAPIEGQPADVQVVTTPAEAGLRRWVERVRGAAPQCVGLLVLGSSGRWAAYRYTPAVPGSWVRVDAPADGFSTRTDALRAVWAPTAPRLVRTDSAAILSTP